MRDQHVLRDLLHRAAHCVPGVPAHLDQPAGHQGRAGHGHARRRPPARHHGPGGSPRVLVAWQTRIARLFGQEPR
ncbi:hypothetical protein MF672_031955 [Actinomadura sp. ATCC 31491]|uniref:Uncharacterized protein n=1 Tax=Actinomadura luzonensis TaxID=2805427 RepID=A0ABT0G198_9ACTN|nr:hypothetical protein [Actinomadura luzonensis]MCK2218374.1 hypothetical protein [Actinomadura luzonensis]